MAPLFGDLSQSEKLSEIKPPLAIKKRKKGNLWVQLNDFSFPSYFLTFSLFFSLQWCRFYQWQYGAPKSCQFPWQSYQHGGPHQKSQNLLRGKNWLLLEKKSSEMLHNQNYRMLKIHEQFFLYLFKASQNHEKKISPI